ncbi:MAG: hypothetical protein V4436_01885 [Patescibacteria group bacterium]
MAEKLPEENIIGRQSALSLEDQKKLVDYNFKKAQSFQIKMFLIIVPSTLFLVFGILGIVFFLTGIIHF